MNVAPAGNQRLGGTEPNPQRLSQLGSVMCQCKNLREKRRPGSLTRSPRPVCHVIEGGHPANVAGSLADGDELRGMRPETVALRLLYWRSATPPPLCCSPYSP
ncbi:hypothetical protein DPEC_G00327240 [Dallia pectoralis]|uniref:Uncharacterized protein n=1 Tax=Dallia pectoralis TaxID=75939 RepID=A0ACC2F8D3_DALPE|nr:hypothetical protein DPEC_G00327240 [Dallia pectoralis]